MKTIKPKRIENLLDFWKDVAILSWRALPASLLVFLLTLWLPQLAWRNDPNGMIWLVIVQIYVAPVAYFFLLFSICARGEETLRFSIPRLVTAFAHEATCMKMPQLMVSMTLMAMWLLALVPVSIFLVGDNLANFSRVELIEKLTYFLMVNTSILYLSIVIVLGSIVQIVFINLDMNRSGSLGCARVYALVREGIMKNMGIIQPMLLLSVGLLLLETVESIAVLARYLQAALLMIQFTFGVVFYRYVFRGDGLSRKEKVFAALTPRA